MGEEMGWGIENSRDMEPTLATLVPPIDGLQCDDETIVSPGLNIYII